MTELDAMRLIEQALSAAADDQLQVAVAVVDEAGHLLAFRRHRNAYPASAELAVAKARTAAMFRRTTQTMQQSLEQGRLSYLALPGALPLAGGVPLSHHGQVVGALGISGASSSEDSALAQATVQALGWSGVPT